MSSPSSTGCPCGGGGAGRSSRGSTASANRRLSFDPVAALRCPGSRTCWSTCRATAARRGRTRRERPRGDSRIGSRRGCGRRGRVVLGHSMGGVLAPLVAERGASARDREHRRQPDRAATARSALQADAYTAAIRSRLRDDARRVSRARRRADRCAATHAAMVLRVARRVPRARARSRRDEPRRGPRAAARRACACRRCYVAGVPRRHLRASRARGSTRSARAGSASSRPGTGSTSISPSGSRPRWPRSWRVRPDRASAIRRHLLVRGAELGERLALLRAIDEALHAEQPDQPHAFVVSSAVCTFGARVIGFGSAIASRAASPASAPRGVAEPLARRGLGAEHAVAPLDDVQVELEDALLRQVILERERDQHLARLAEDAALRRQVEVLRELLRDRAAADLARPSRSVCDRLLDRAPVDAVVRVEVVCPR